MIAKSQIHPSLFISPSKIHGLGVFTNSEIAKGSTLVKFSGNLFNKNDIELGLCDPKTTIAIDDNLWLGNTAGTEKEIDDYINHSCNPNTWLDDATTLVASQYIGKYEEIVTDYAVWINNPNYFLTDNCLCGATSCRKFITGNDWRHLDVIIKNYGHFSPFINVKIDLLLEKLSFIRGIH